MMSKISTLYDAFRTRLSVVLPTHKELVNVQTIEDNDELFLSKGQNFHLDVGQNTNRILSCKLSVARQAVVTITRAVRGHERDIEERVTTTKDILEDQFLVIQDFEKDPTIGSEVSKILYLNDGGMQEVFTGAGHYLMIRTTFELEYIEDLS